MSWRRFATGLISTIIGGSMLLSTAPVAALSGSDFHAGHIIDDSLFFDGNSMSTGDVQNFLNAKVPVCDTNGTQPYAGTTRAAYSTSKGYPPPYICLKDYHTTTIAKAAEADICAGYAAVSQSAAEIISGVAHSCGVSAKVLIVLLQKEQGLVTDDWPWPTQYQKATGYGCPDTAPCDSQYYGFFNQVYSAARQFKRYALFSGNYNYQANANNFIQYNPSSSCGGSTVFVQNQATAGLYNYTPYQPNAGALAGLNDNTAGGTAPCGAYGNRNFWWYYNRWFGNTLDPFDNAAIRLTAPLTITPNNPIQGDNFTLAFSISNSGDVPITIGSPMVAIRGPQGQNRDAPLDNNVTIQAHSTYTYSKQWATPDPGWHQFSIVLYKPGLGFSYADPAGTDPNVVRNLWANVQQNPHVITALSVTPGQPAVGQTYTASFAVRNDSSQAVDIGYPFVVVRGPQGQNRDIPIGDHVVIPANSTYTYSKDWRAAETGKYTFAIATWRPEINMTSLTYPAADSNVSKTVTTTILDNPTINASLTLNPAQVVAGVPYTATFSVINKAATAVAIGSPLVVVRGPQGQNRDVPIDNNVTIAANSTYTYSKQWVTPDPGWHQFSIVTYKAGSFDYFSPKTANDTIVRNMWVNVKPNPRIITSISVNPASPHVNQQYTVSFAVRNDSAQAVDIGYPFVVVRGPQGQNRDVPISDHVIIPANSTYTYSKQWVATETGPYMFSVATWQSATGVSLSYPLSDSGVARTLTATVVP